MSWLASEPARGVGCRSPRSRGRRIRPPIRSAHALAAAAIVGAATLLPPAETAAQGWIDKDRAVAPTRDEDSSRPSPPSAGSKDFEIGLNLPARYSSNVVNPSRDSLEESRGDRHVAPEVYLKWSRQYDWAKLSAEVGAGIDRYAQVHDANLDMLYGSFKIAKSDRGWDLFSPYVAFSNVTYFEPTFRTTSIAYHDIAAGFSTGIGWRDRELIPYRDALIPYRDASETGDVSVMFDARVGRRMSDMTDYQNTFVSVKAELSYIFARNWRVDATTNFRGRWYADYFGEKRTDYRPGAGLGLIWTPDWLKAKLPRSQLGLNFDFYRNYSNLPEKKYSLWEVGPTLELRVKF